MRKMVNGYSWTEKKRTTEFILHDLEKWEAEKLCAEEKERRKHDQSFSGFADNFILPIGYDDYWPNDRNMVKNGYIIERITRQ